MYRLTVWLKTIRQSVWVTYADFATQQLLLDYVHKHDNQWRNQLVQHEVEKDGALYELKHVNGLWTIL